VQRTSDKGKGVKEKNNESQTDLSIIMFWPKLLTYVQSPVSVGIFASLTTRLTQRYFWIC